MSETPSTARTEAERRMDDEFEESLIDYHDAGYESPVTEWERNFWEAGYRRGVTAGVTASRAQVLAEAREGIITQVDPIFGVMDKIVITTWAALAVLDRLGGQR